MEVAGSSQGCLTTQLLSLSFLVVTAMEWMIITTAAAYYLVLGLEASRETSVRKGVE
jgi:hypothetical protein